MFLGLFQLGKITSKLPSFVADNFCCENAFSYLNAEIRKKLKRKHVIGVMPVWPNRKQARIERKEHNPYRSLDSYWP